MTNADLPKRIHVLAKPTGSTCNLNCDYCFYLKKESLYPGSRFRMSDEVLEAYLSQLIAALRQRCKTRFRRACLRSIYIFNPRGVNHVHKA